MDATLNDEQIAPSVGTGFNGLTSEFIKTRQGVIKAISSLQADEEARASTVNGIWKSRFNRKSQHETKWEPSANAKRQ